jgi:hypothetical protein
VVRGVHVDDVAEVHRCDIGGVLDRLKVDRGAGAIALELDHNEPPVARLDPDDPEHVEAFGGAIKTVKLRGQQREVAARQLRRRHDPRLEILTLPQLERREGCGLDLDHPFALLVDLEQRHPRGVCREICVRPLRRWIITRICMAPGRALPYLDVTGHGGRRRELGDGPCLGVLRRGTESLEHRAAGPDQRDLRRPRCPGAPFRSGAARTVSQRGTVLGPPCPRPPAPVAETTSATCAITQERSRGRGSDATTAAAESHSLA